MSQPHSIDWDNTAGAARRPSRESDQASDARLATIRKTSTSAVPHTQTVPPLTPRLSSRSQVPFDPQRSSMNRSSPSCKARWFFGAFTSRAVTPRMRSSRSIRGSNSTCAQRATRPDLDALDLKHRHALEGPLFALEVPGADREPAALEPLADLDLGSAPARLESPLGVRQGHRAEPRRARPRVRGEPGGDGFSSGRGRGRRRQGAGRG